MYRNRQTKNIGGIDASQKIIL